MGGPRSTMLESGIWRLLLGTAFPWDDLHFYRDGHACLGFSYPWDPPFTSGTFHDRSGCAVFLPASLCGSLWAFLRRVLTCGPSTRMDNSVFLEHRQNVRRGLLAGR